SQQFAFIPWFLVGGVGLRAMCSIKSHRSILQARSRWPWCGCGGGLALCYPSLTRGRSHISRKTLRQVRCSSLARNTNCSLRFQSVRIAVGFRDGPSNSVTGDARGPPQPLVVAQFLLFPCRGRFLLRRSLPRLITPS